MAKVFSIRPIPGLQTFRRAGFVFEQHAPTMIPAESLSEEQLAALEAERGRSLVIEELDSKAAPPAPPPGEPHAVDQADPFTGDEAEPSEVTTEPGGRRKPKSHR